MGVSLSKAPVRPFAGMVYPLDRTFGVPVEHVQPVRSADIPAALRAFTRTLLGGQMTGEWYALGEFRYAGECYETAVARRHVRAGAVWFEYGIEI